MNIPVAHVQGGEVTGSIDEKVRHAVTKLADLHFVASRRAADRVIRMGEDPASVHVTGCPSIDLVAELLASGANLDFDPVARYGGVGPPVKVSNGYLVVMQHPVTTEYHHARRHALETLQAVTETRIPTLWFWPNPDAGSDGTSAALRTFRETAKPDNIHFFKNMAPSDFLRLIHNSKCLVGNSSVGIRECSYLGVPVVNVGSRQRGRDRGVNVIDADYDRDCILGALDRHMSNGRYPQDQLYGDGHAGERIASSVETVQLSIEKRLTY
jgi:UDP-hydrolysing UDP-N-acetyl-D-glucosamine 2-epimerase